jgi:hypothetical protein
MMMGVTQGRSLAWVQIRARLEELGVADLTAGVAGAEDRQYIRLGALTSGGEQAREAPEHQRDRTAPEEQEQQHARPTHPGYYAWFAHHVEPPR